MLCKHCQQEIEKYKGFWWDEGNDFMCPDGETFHQQETTMSKDPKPRVIIDRYLNLRDHLDVIPALEQTAKDLEISVNKVRETMGFTIQPEGDNV
jgi:hypothetical protein